jgi:hypothetical protein
VIGVLARQVVSGSAAAQRSFASDVTVRKVLRSAVPSLISKRSISFLDDAQEDRWPVSKNNTILNVCPQGKW